MPRARNRFDRAVQALRWCEKQWPTGRPVYIEWRDVLIDYDTGKPDKALHGQTYRDGNSIVIEMKEQRCRSCLMGTLFHEYAHAIQWPLAKVEHRPMDHHDSSFYALLGQIENLWNEIGWEEANECEWE